MTTKNEGKVSAEGFFFLICLFSGGWQQGENCVCWEACDSGRRVMRLPDANDITFSQTRKVFFSLPLICCRKLHYKNDKCI